VWALQPPRPRRKDKKTIPSLETFLTPKTEEELEKLEGTKLDKVVDGLAAWPNCVLTHPSLFSQLNSQHQVEACTTGITLVNPIIATNRTNASLNDKEEEPDKEDEEERLTNRKTKSNDRKADGIGPECNNLILYLWNVANRFRGAVLLVDPPDSNLVDARNQAVFSQLHNQHQTLPKHHQPNLILCSSLLLPEPAQS
jgi:hypothetical protein